MTILFRRVHIEPEKLREIIRKNSDSLEFGLRFIDFQLGTEEEGFINFLGIDKNRRLAVVNCDSDENESMVLTALSQLQWLKKNESLLKRLFFSENVDMSRVPQIILIGPSFSRKAVAAVQQLSGHDIRLVEFKYSLAGNNDAIMFEEVVFRKAGAGNVVGLSEQPPVPEDIPDNARAGVCRPVAPVPENIEQPVAPFDEITLTPEEIAEFMNFDRKQTL